MDYIKRKSIEGSLFGGSEFNEITRKQFEILTNLGYLHNEIAALSSRDAYMLISDHVID